MHWPFSTSHRPLASTGRAERPRFERHHRQALEVRRHDQQIGGGHRVELVRVGEEAEMADARMLGNRQDRRCRSARDRAPRGNVARSAGSKSNSSAAALVLVDAADVDRERAVDVELLPEARRARCARARPSRRRRRRRAPSALPATAWIIARSSGELYMIARTPRNTGANIASPIAGSRSAVGTRIGLAGSRARAVIRVVVAVAEEEEVVERRRDRAR